jgi:hypothetical protein
MNPAAVIAYSFDVFISYARADRDVVEGLVDRLKSDRFTVWWDIEQMAGGSIVLGQLADGILHSAHMIACLSDAYIDRDFTAFELQTNQSLDAANKQNRTIPVKVRPLKREIPAQIRSFNSCDLTDEATYDAEYRRVIAMINRALKSAAPQETEDGLRVKYEAALGAQGDANLALFRARIAAEAFARFLYRKLIGSPAAGSTLDSLVDGLLTARKLPAHIGVSLGTVQTYGNLMVQEGADLSAVTQASIQPGMAALKVLADWTFATYVEKYVPKEAWDAVWDELPEGVTPDERAIPGSRFVLRRPRIAFTDAEAVYAGRHVVSRQSVDIRLSLVPPAQEDLFFEEISRYARLGGAAILRPLDAGRVVANGKRLCVYVAIEQLDGPTAEELMRRFGPLPVAAACAICAGVAGALEILQGSEPAIVHGAITPVNIVVDRYGNVKLLCIGLQKLQPDAARDVAADLRMLRATLVALLTGGGSEGYSTNEMKIAAALDACENASDARAILESAVMRAPDTLDLRTVITRFREKRPLPEHIALSAETTTIPQVRLGLPSEFTQLSETPVDAVEAWPLGEHSVLVLERGNGALAIFEGSELKWRDPEPIQFRLSATAAGNRVAVGGWEGKVRCFSEIELPTKAALFGAVGAIAAIGDDWLAGTWRNALVRVAPGNGVVPVPPLIENGVLRIAVAPDRIRFAVADLRGAISLYYQGRRVASTVPFPGLRSLAFCGRRVVALAGGILISVDWDGRIGASDRPPGGPSASLVPYPAGNGCLVIAEDGQTWSIDENGAHLPYARFAERRSILSFAYAPHRFTAAYLGGCAYWRQVSAPLKVWPDATSATLSYDGRWIAVRSPGKVSLYFDPL